MSRSSIGHADAEETNPKPELFMFKKRVVNFAIWLVYIAPAIAIAIQTLAVIALGFFVAGYIVLKLTGILPA